MNLPPKQIFLGQKVSFWQGILNTYLGFHCTVSFFHTTRSLYGVPPTEKLKNYEQTELFTKRQNFRLVQIESRFADDKINVNQKLKFDLERIENIVGIGENAGYQGLFLGVVKSRDCVAKA